MYRHSRKSLEASAIKNMDAIVHSQPTDTHTNKNTEKDINSTLLDDGTICSSHTVNALIDLEDHGQNATRNDNTTTVKETTNNTNIYQNQQHKQPVKLIELTENSDPLNTILTTLPSVNTPLPRLQRQNSVHFNTEPVILNNSTRETLTNNQNIHINPQHFVNLVRQLNSQRTQQTTNAPTPYYLQLASPQTPYSVLYLYLGGANPCNSL